LARDQGLNEEIISQIADYEHGAFIPREKAALKYADLLASDPHAIDDRLFEELHEHFNDEEIVELGWCIAMYLGFGRLIYSFGLEYKALAQDES
jgi:alkylhydroperoxidase family enzyme